MINPFSALTRSKPIQSGNYSPFLVLGDGKTLANNTVDASFALKNSDIFAITLRVASDLGRVKLTSTNPIAQKVLDSPNNLSTDYALKQEILASMILNGNAYVSIDRDSQNNPIKLEFLPMSWLQIELQDDAEDINYTINYDDGRPQKVYKSADMLHFKLFLTGQLVNQYSGISPLTSLVSELNIQGYSNQLSLSTLKNAIAPSYTLTVPEGMLDPDAKENIRQQFEAQNSGSNSGRAIVLDQGLKLDTLSINPDIAKLLSNNTFSQTQIAKAFCIPDSYLNGQGDAQSSVEMLKSLYANSLPIYLEPVVSEIKKKLGTEIRTDVRDVVDFDHSQLIADLVSLTNSSNPILDATQAQSILKDKGIFDLDIMKPTVPTQEGVKNNG